MPRVPRSAIEDAMGRSTMNNLRDVMEYARHLGDVDDLMEKRYFTLRARSLDVLDREVNRAMALGFEPLGGPQVVYRKIDTAYHPVKPEAWHVQAMVAGQKVVTNGSEGVQKEVT